MLFQKTIGKIVRAFPSLSSFSAEGKMGAERNAFESIYKYNLWGGGSGAGSSPRQAVPYLLLLRGLLSHPCIHTVSDLGCGDWQIMETIDIPEAIQYKGFDLVKSVIDGHSQKYAKPNVSFHHLNSLEDFLVESGDLLIVKDVLHHWPLEQIQFFLEGIMPQFKFVLMINGYAPLECDSETNGIIKFGGYRPLDLKGAPFQNLTNEVGVLMDYPSHGFVKRVHLYQNPKNKDDFVEGLL